MFGTSWSGTEAFTGNGIGSEQRCFQSDQVKCSLGPVGGEGVGDTDEPTDFLRSTCGTSEFLFVSTLCDSGTHLAAAASSCWPAVRRSVTLDKAESSIHGIDLTDEWGVVGRDSRLLGDVFWT